MKESNWKPVFIEFAKFLFGAMCLMGVIYFLRLLSEHEKNEAVELLALNQPQFNFCESLNAEYHSHLCEASGDCVILMKDKPHSGVGGNGAWAVQAWCNEHICQIATIRYNQENICGEN